MLFRGITAFLVGFALAGCVGVTQNAIFGKCSPYSAPGTVCPTLKGK